MGDQLVIIVVVRVVCLRGPPHVVTEQTVELKGSGMPFFELS